MMFLPTLVVGVIGGLVAALFTWVNLKICKWRNRNVLPKPWARIAEPIVVAFVTTTLAVMIPYLFDCMSTRCQEDPGLPGCNRRSVESCPASAERRPLLTPSSLARYSSSSVEEDGLQLYTCTQNTTYNPAATLFFTMGDKTIDHLLSRNTHYQVSTARRDYTCVEGLWAERWHCDAVRLRGTLRPVHRLLLAVLLHGRDGACVRDDGAGLAHRRCACNDCVV
jgi:hypothetical protein